SDLIADAQLSALRGRGADLALSNPDSLRTSLPRGPLDYSTLHRVQPYGDRLYLVTVSGDELLEMLGHSADDLGAHGPAVSDNAEYTGVTRLPEGVRVTDVLVAAEPLAPSRDYTFVVSGFLAPPESGGSPITDSGGRRVAGINDID